LIIGVDLGGTNIEAAAVRGGTVLASKKKKTKADRGAEVVIDRIETTVRKMMDKMDATPSDFEALCIGAPGAVDPETGVVREAPNLNWKNVALGEQLRERFDLPVMVDNDVNIGVMGEHAYGAGKGARHMVGIFVGTGIGGGLVIDGKPHYGGRGAAGEIGHIVVEPHGRRCGCGRQGCVEAYASKTAMEAMIREEIEKGRESVVLDVMEEKGKERLTSSVIGGSLEENDALMEEALQTAQYYLGLLTADLVNTLDPEVVVFGGGVVEELGAPFVEPVAQTARQHYLQRKGAEQIRVVPAALGDDAGPVGAAEVARRRLQGATG
jgi:glucokinase